MHWADTPLITYYNPVRSDIRSRTLKIQNLLTFFIHFHNNQPLKSVLEEIMTLEKDWVLQHAFNILGSIKMEEYILKS